jgi:hypothetical protein
MKPRPVILRTGVACPELVEGKNLGLYFPAPLLLVPFSIFSRGPGEVDHLTLQKKGVGGI